MDMAKVAEPETASLTRAGRRLEYLMLGRNLTEAAVAIGAGFLAGSIALIGFGADSLIESLSGGILLWRLYGSEADERRERLALKLAGVSFLVLAGYVAVDASASLVSLERPNASVIGIVLSVVCLVVMPLLASAKRRVAGRLHSRALRADSRQTEFCAYLSAILLGGLLLNALFGWWWSDPVAAVVIVPFIAKEGIDVFRGDRCS
jgi:divalent metal cation (Fe/Co/Zn/Cd) transporter